MGWAMDSSLAPEPLLYSQLRPFFHRRHDDFTCYLRYSRRHRTHSPIYLSRSLFLRTRRHLRRELEFQMRVSALCSRTQLRRHETPAKDSAGQANQRHGDEAPAAPTHTRLRNQEYRAAPRRGRSPPRAHDIFIYPASPARAPYHLANHRPPLAPRILQSREIRAGNPTQLRVRRAAARWDAASGL